MKINFYTNIPAYCIVALIVSALALMPGCAIQPGGTDYAVRSGEFPDFVAVVAQPGDTLPLLAERYLHDAKKAWIIADFNDITSVSAGDELIVPLEPFTRGGLSRERYQTVPVLTYHNFSESKQNLMMVRKEDFEQQMKFLKDNGYTPVTLDALFDFLDYKAPLPEKAVVITIDDGWSGVYDIAYPILRKYGFPSTLFVYTDLINGNRKTLSWSQVAELYRGGMDIQCHSKTHRNFNKVKEQESFADYVRDIEQEIGVSTRLIKEKLNKDVKYVAYPYGDTNNFVVALLLKQGFRGAFTVKRGSNPFFQEQYIVNRSMIYGDYDLQDFKRNLKLYSTKALN